MDPVTRRTWMITIGAGLAVLPQSEAGPSATPLPPGLYDPSRDHLSHALMSADRIHPIPPGCPTDYVKPREGPFEPLFFSAPEFMAIRRLTELLLGDSPGERDLSQEIAEWIDLRVSSAAGVRQAEEVIPERYRNLADAYSVSGRSDHSHTEDIRKICRDGLTWIGPDRFVALKTDDQISLLDTISDARPDSKVENAGTRLFVFLKGEVIRGFYTSKIGLKELDFKGNAFYARSPGCDTQTI